MGVDPEEQVAVLQARIHDRLDALREIARRAGPDRDTDPDGVGVPRTVREIDLTDGIDLTDARLAGSGWDDTDPEDTGLGGIDLDDTDLDDTDLDDTDLDGPGLGGTALGGTALDDADPDDVGSAGNEPGDGGEPGDPDAAEAAGRGAQPWPSEGSGRIGLSTSGPAPTGYPDLSISRDTSFADGDSGRQGWQRHRAGADGTDPADRGPRLLGGDLRERRGTHPSTLQEATDAVIAATRELIAYERRLPVLLDAEPRRLSLMIVRWSGLVSALVAGSLLLTAFSGVLARWWVLPGLVCSGAAYLLLRLPVHPPGDRHETLRPGSVVVAFGALVTAICAAAGMPPTVLLLGIVSIAAGIWHAQQTPLRISAQPRKVR